MTRDDLVRMSTPHGINPQGLDDRELALVLLTLFGIDLDAATGLRSQTIIRDAALPHLLTRLTIVAEGAATSPDDPNLLSAVESVAWMRQRVYFEFADLARGRESGALKPRWVDGSAFYDRSELARLAKTLAVS